MLARLVVSAACLMAALPAPLLSAEQRTYRFQTHAAFFSAETNQMNPLDPQVFAADPVVPAGTGPQRIVHVAGFRPVLLSDPPSTALDNANGKPLPIDLGVWLSASGSASIAGLSNGRQKVALRFAHLVPNGVYSVFENHFSPNGVSFTPLDGSGTTNTFTAGSDGNATANITAPEPFTHANAILLVYHSDGQSHGLERGAIGIVAHHHLIMRFP